MGDATRQQLVLDAIREHEFDVIMDIEQRLDEPPGSFRAEPGTWLVTYEESVDETFQLLFPPGAELPKVGDSWQGRMQIIGADEDIQARVLT